MDKVVIKDGYTYNEFDSILKNAKDKEDGTFTVQNISITKPTGETNSVEEAVDKYVEQLADPNGSLNVPKEVSPEQSNRTRGYSAAWLLGVLTGAVSVGMLVLSSFLMK